MSRDPFADSRRECPLFWALMALCVALGCVLSAYFPGPWFQA